MALLESEAALMCETLVREIGRAQRWTAAVSAWQALQNVRRMADDMERERAYLDAPDRASAGPAGGFVPCARDDRQL